MPLLTELRQHVTLIFRRLEKELLEEEREQLLIQAYRHDPNRNIHTMLRLTKARERLRTRGALGGALVLSAMAETIRRQTEDTFGTRLDEEDEVGPSPKFKSFKVEIYGSNRLLDGDETPRREFLRSFDLDRGVRLRWYVEGETEAGALERFVEEYNLSYLIQVVNYRGQIKRGRTEAFYEDLERDLNAGVFSYVSVDGDDKDVVRVVKNADLDHLICGKTFVSSPDFELANFTLGELEEVVWKMTTEHDNSLNASQEDRFRLHNALQGCGSGKELERVAREVLPPGSERFSKGARWGQYLMEHAMLQPRFPDGSERPIVNALWEAVTARRSSYQVTRDQMWSIREPDV